jgi:eukaryotic-like serine/threonine-protein kinase
MVGIASGTVVGGKYRLEEAIGRGGMASVWRATHTTLETPVAVKFLEMFGSSRNQMATRFLREAKLAGVLRHRNVVHILDYGVMPDGQPFMVMELLEGTSLADRFDHGPPMTDLELFDIAALVLSGLGAVHAAGIVHRDVKPDNIFLVRDADGVYPKLLDFGISRGVEGPDERVTRTGAVIGTPLYMSPEQARGMKDLDQRADLWSVGMILWEGLTGTLPFMSENMGDVLIRVATEDAPSVKVSRPDLPDPVVDVVARAIKRDRNQRFADAREMREAVVHAAELLEQQSGLVRRRDPSAIRRVPSAAVAHTAVSEPPPRARWPFFVAGAVVFALTSIVIAFIAVGGEIRFTSAAAEPEPAAAPPAAPDPPPPAVTPPVALPAPSVALPAPVEPAPPAAPVVEAAVVEARRPRRVEPRKREPAQRATTAESPPRGGRGGFVRDLDY